jgi:sulfite reductase (ferredoxin)
MSEQSNKKSAQEAIKESSQYLRGKVTEELADANSYVSDESYELLKFHGTYQGYDRDTATERKKAGLDKHYEFMVRLKIPAGRLKAWQYMELDSLADSFANGSLRITTRETFQFHCIIKENLKPSIAAMNRMLLTTLGGCGDVVRNIMACPAPVKDNIHATLEHDAYRLAVHLAPRTTAYHEIFLDGEKYEDYPFNPLPPEPENVEPLYGTHYLPRKFKIGIGTAEDNCIDLLTHDLGILALFDEKQTLIGYNFLLGGGLGMTHNQPNTYPRLASPIAFAEPEDFIRVSEAVVKMHRDYGDRSNRKHARLKYVVEEQGIEWTRHTLEKLAEKKLADPHPVERYDVEDHTGWHPQGDGKWFLGVPVSSGRIVDREGEYIRTGLREIIREYGMDLTLTATQNIILCDVEEKDIEPITKKLKSFGIKLKEDITPLYRNFLACVALPTCGKALAEAERVKLPLVGELESLFAKYGLSEENISVRIAGCPNGCSRPYVGDIGIVGRMPDHYALFIGGDFAGTRLNSKIYDRIPFDQLPTALEPMFAFFKANRQPEEGFGDFAHRIGVEVVKQQTVNALGESFKWAKE